MVQKWLLFHISSPATKEIHVLFDHPGQMEFSPKDVERTRRDTTASPTSNISVTFPIENSTSIPSGVKLWREFTSERHCKRELIKYLTKLLLDILPEYLKGHQKFITAGGFDDPARKDKALMCSQSMKDSLPVEVSALASNHEETDSRAWLHALTGSTNNVLIFSPDTDTYHIGLPLLGRNSRRKVVVQLSNTYDKHEFLFFF